jgi:hypothetical protein
MAIRIASNKLKYLDEVSYFFECAVFSFPHRVARVGHDSRLVVEQPLSNHGESSHKNDVSCYVNDILGVAPVFLRYMIAQPLP